LSSHAAEANHINGNGMSTPWCPAAAMPAEHAQSDQSTAAAPTADTQKKAATTSAQHRGATEQTLRMFAARPNSLAGILQAGNKSVINKGSCTAGPHNNWPMAGTRRNFLGASFDPAQALFTALSQSFFILVVCHG
jgi:hypothetical protein